MNTAVMQIITSGSSYLHPRARGSAACILNEALSKLAEAIAIRVVKAVAGQQASQVWPIRDDEHAFLVCAVTARVLEISCCRSTPCTGANDDHIVRRRAEVWR